MRFLIMVCVLTSVSFSQNINWQLRDITSKVETCQRQLTELNQERLHQESITRQRELSQNIYNYGQSVAGIMQQVYLSADSTGMCDGVPVKTRVIGTTLFLTILPIMALIVTTSIASHR